MNESLHQRAVTLHRNIQFERQSKNRRFRPKYAISAPGPPSYDVAYGGVATGTLFEPAFPDEQILQVQTCRHRP